MFFKKSTVCMLADYADWGCYHDLWGLCSYLVTVSQEIGYTLHYIIQKSPCLNFQAKHCKEILEKILLITSALP